MLMIENTTRVFVKWFLVLKSSKELSKLNSQPQHAFSCYLFILVRGFLLILPISPWEFKILIPKQARKNIRLITQKREQRSVLKESN